MPDSSETYAYDVAHVITHYDEVGSNPGRAHTVTAFDVATIDGKPVGTMSVDDDGDDRVWTFLPKAETTTALTALAEFLRTFETADLTFLTADEQSDVKRAYHLLGNVANNHGV